MDTNNTDCCCLEAKPADQGEKSSSSWDIKYLLAILVFGTIWWLAYSYISAVSHWLVF